MACELMTKEYSNIRKFPGFLWLLAELFSISATTQQAGVIGGAVEVFENSGLVEIPC